jgi:propionyl-CoA carboxylase alpha chain
LVRVLESHQFATGETDTHFIERHDLDTLAGPLADHEAESHAARAAALADQALERASARVLGTIPSGFRNTPSRPQHRAYSGPVSEHQVSYILGRKEVVFDGDDSAELITVTPDRVEFDRQGLVHEFDVARYGNVRHVDSPTVPSRLVEIPRFPDASSDEETGSLHSPMPGKIVRVDAMVDDIVKEGQILVVLEAMKMEHSIRAPHAGRVVRVDCAPGDQVEADAILIVVEETGEPPN